MPVDIDEPTPSELARAALKELDAEDVDTSPAELMGGTLAWGESSVAMIEAERDPSNAPAMRPHVIAPCQKLQSQPALRLHCTCGKGLDYLALASLTSGVMVISSPTLLPPKRRTGGPGDLGPIGTDDPEAGWALLPWEASMRDRAATHQTSWNSDVPHFALGENVIVVGDTAKRQTFHCEHCGATPTFKNIQLLRLVLKAVEIGERKVRLAPNGERK
jgi:hypothetical protein